MPDYTEIAVQRSTYLPASLVATGCKYPPLHLGFSTVLSNFDDETSSRGDAVGLRRKLLLLKPDSYENFRAMDFHELSDEDLLYWHTDLSRILAALPSADTLFIPHGGYKLSMNEPKVLLSLGDYEADVKQLGVSPNHLPAFDSPDDMALDVSAMVISDPRAAFLASVPLAESLRRGMALGLYQLFADFGSQIQEAIEAHKKGASICESDEEAAWSEAESEEDEPLIRTDLPVSYEVQIRGVNRSPPSIAARPPTGHLLLGLEDNSKRVPSRGEATM